MYLGRLCEAGPGRDLFRRPRHPYTRALIDSVPLPDPAAAPRAPALAGEPASVFAPPAGCAFHPRCPHAIDRCRSERPELIDHDGSRVACHRAAELDLAMTGG